MMDKLNIALEIIYNCSKGGEPPLQADISDIFDLVDIIESEAIRRGFYFPKICPKCLSELKIIALSTHGHASFRVNCNCVKAEGKSSVEAISKWWEFVND
jgi:hypothetical protein